MRKTMDESPWDERDSKELPGSCWVASNVNLKNAAGFENAGNLAQKLPNDCFRRDVLEHVRGVHKVKIIIS